MTKVIINEDCGNAPKKQYIKNFLIAIANANIEAVAGMLDQDVRLDIPGQRSLHGIDSVRRLLISDVGDGEALELDIHNILSHGSRCAANGVLKHKDGREVSFCGVYVFSSHSKDVKLTNITVYLIVSKSVKKK